MPSSLLDFPFDTTRTAVHMTLNGVMSRHTRMKVILSHAGGFLPDAAWRFTGGTQFNPDTTPMGIPDGPAALLLRHRTVHHAVRLPSPLGLAAPGHICDFPLAPEGSGDLLDSLLESYESFQPGQLDAINRGSVEALFPRLAAA
ncbi:hypothetical protein ACQPXH_19775 [Nocardia sp. CA-135953]|uniref:hypothetical protein n=1 Tax=Nocardia sp. CA-135953 TaxID=3239978 RepID=UPI003D9873CE